MDITGSQPTIRVQRILIEGSVAASKECSTHFQKGQSKKNLHVVIRTTMLLFPLQTHCPPGLLQGESQLSDKLTVLYVPHNVHPL